MTKGFALKSFILIVGILLALILLILTFSNKEEGLDDVSLVESFYSQYIDNQLVDITLITEELEAQLEGKDISAVLCSFSFDDVKIDNIESKDDVVFVYLVGLEDPIKVYTAKEDGELKVNNIVCTTSVEEDEEIVEDEEIIEDVVEDEVIGIAIPEVARELVNLAKKDLASRLNTDIANIMLAGLEDVTFSDTSLGLSQPGEAYNQVITPGYILVLEISGKHYRYHTNKSSVVIFVTQD